MIYEPYKKKKKTQKTVKQKSELLARLSPHVPGKSSVCTPLQVPLCTWKGTRVLNILHALIPFLL